MFHFHQHSHRVDSCVAPAKISDYVLVLSPIKTTEFEICPPTPRTKILNEWSCENRQLKALVETERYEKGFLELQLKKKEEQINVLSKMSGGATPLGLGILTAILFTFCF